MQCSGTCGGAVGGAHLLRPCSYTVLAARRAEHRKLHHFIRLTDYIIRDTLHAMVVSSAQDVLDFMHAPRMMQSIDLLMNPVDEVRARARARCRGAMRPGAGGERRWRG